MRLDKDFIRYLKVNVFVELLCVWPLYPAGLSPHVVGAVIQDIC